MQASTIKYIAEIRTRLLKITICNLLVFAAIGYWASNIYAFVAKPLLSNLPKSARMIATDITSPLFAPLKITLIVAILISLPYTIGQIWRFVMPALYKHERAIIIFTISLSTILFYLGLAFGFFIICPVVLKFFSSIHIEQVHMATDINKYLSFIIKLLVGCGLAFEVPIIVIAIITLNLASIEQIKQKRPYVIVGAFVLGMLLTPPDVISQSILAIPILILFELGLFIGGRIKKKVDSRVSN